MKPGSLFLSAARKTCRKNSAFNEKNAEVLFLTVSIAILLAFVPTNQLYHFSQLAVPTLEECMFHARLFRKVFCLLCFGLAVWLSGGLAGSATAQTSDEAAVRAVVEQYYQLYAKKDVAGLMQLWSERAPAYPATKQLLEKDLQAASLEIKDLKLEGIVVEGEKARLRCRFTLITKAPTNAEPDTKVQVRSLELTRAGATWLLWANTSAFDDLAEVLISTADEAARKALLERNGELVSVELVDALNYRGNMKAFDSEHADVALIAELSLPLCERLRYDGGKASVYFYLAESAYRQARHAKAIELLQQCLNIREIKHDRRGIASALNSLANNYDVLDQNDQAKEFYGRSLKIAEELNDKTHMANALRNIGQMHSKIGQYTAAMEAFERSLQLYTEIKARRGTAIILSDIGLTDYYQGRLMSALTRYLQSLKIREETNDRRGKALMLLRIGMVYDNQGNFAQALNYYEQSRQAWAEMNDKYNLAEVLLNLGGLYNDRDESAKSIEYFQESRKLFVEIGARREAAKAWHNLGNEYRKQGQFNTALSYFQQSLAVYEELHYQREIGSTLKSIGQCYWGKGDYAQALEFNRRAATIAQSLNDADSLWGPQENIGRAYRGLKQAAAARQAFQQAIQTIELLRQQTLGISEQSQNFFANKISSYFELTDLLLEQKQDAEAFAFAERSKARTLLDSLQSGREQLDKVLTSDERQSQTEAQTRLTTLNSRLTREAQKTTSDVASMAELKTQIEKARLDYEALETKLYVAHPELKVKRGELAPIALSETMALLNNKTALLEFSVGENKTHLFVVTARNGKPVLQTFTLALKRNDLTAKTEKLRQAFANRNLGYVAPARELYDLLLKPAAVALQGKSRLVIVPDGPLWELPFQALMPADNHFLVENKTISTAPSLTFLREMIRVREKRGKLTTPANILAIGNPALGGEAGLAQRAELMGDKLEPLPFAEQQAIQLGQLYKSNAKVLTGAAATEATVKAEMGKYRILHLATHGVLDDRNPMYSHLVLSQTGNDEKEDGLLEARELLDMDLRADLAVLSACETGRGKIGAGEGMIGLTWALFVAGVPTTVVSQWKVADKSTANLMVSFHQQLQMKNAKGVTLKTKAEALRQAELLMLRNPSTRHPFYWAGFVLVGAD